ncbi:MAG: 50S ribosomal protein L25 [Dehalococcoidales bacterium]|jgi:large subunit ribosomal protein L25|nr:50S ribosomal protein L25 [Dehalococcoidales bacterium]
MAEKIKLKVEKREITGKKVRFLRNRGIVPLHLFGHRVDSMALQGDAPTLQKVLSQAGHTRLIELEVSGEATPRNVMVREVQKDPIRGNLIHVDLYQVTMTEKIKVEVPIVLVGESPALKSRDNMLYQDLNSLTIECLPDKMPDRIQVDISIITEPEQAIRVKDIAIPDITILNEPDLVIAKVSARPVEVVEEAKAAAPVEGAAEAGAGAEGEAKAETKGEAKGETKTEKK